MQMTEIEWVALGLRCCVCGRLIEIGLIKPPGCEHDIPVAFKANAAADCAHRIEREELPQLCRGCKAVPE